MNDKRLRAAFGEPPASFEEAMMKAIERHRQNGKRRFGARELLIAAAIIALLCGAAYAAVRGFGLLDLLTQRQPVLPEATALVQEGIEQTGGDLPDVTFTLEQVISDGKQIYFTLRATPKRPDEVMLVDAYGFGSAGASVDHWKNIPDEQKSALTFVQAAEQQGKQLLYAYLIHAEIGDVEHSSFNQHSLAYDGGDIIYVFAMEHEAQPGEMIDLRLAVQSEDPMVGEASVAGGSLTARVKATSDVTNYNWDSPVDVPDMGITITQLYVSATPTGLNTHVHYKPIDGADEITVLEVADLWALSFVDGAGNEIEPIHGANNIGNTAYLNDGSYLYSTVLPVEQPFTGLNFKGADSAIRFDVKDARPDPGGNALPKGEALSNGWDVFDTIEAGSDYSHPSAEVTLGDGARIPLLRDFDTEYSGLVETMEQLAADVNLSASHGGFTLTIDQLAATDGYIWFSYTLKSDEPLAIERPDIRGKYAADLAQPSFTATLDGDTENALYSTKGDTFHPDPYTLTGWTRLQSMDNPQIIPEKFRLRLWTHDFANTRVNTGDAWWTIDNTPYGYEIAIDRTRATQGVRSIQPDVRLAVGENEIHVVNLSMSPIGNIMIMDETVWGKAPLYGDDFLLVDESGNALTVEQTQSQTTPGGKDQRVTVRHAIAFVGGLDAQSIRVIPRVWTEQDDVHSTSMLMPIDQPLPFTASFGDGDDTTIEHIELDANGMTIRYRTTCPQQVPLALMSGEDEYCDIKTEWTGMDSLDRLTGVYTKQHIWRAERGAPEGEKLKQETLEQIKYIHFYSWNDIPQWDQAVEISLGGDRIDE